MTGCQFQHLIQFGEEEGDPICFILHLPTFDGQTHNVDGREGEVATANGGLLAKTVFEDTCTTTHGGHFVPITLGIVCTPILMLVEGRIQVQEVGEEPTGGHLASQLIEVVIAVGRQIADSTLLLPDLDREDGRLAIAYSSIGALQ